MLRLQRDHRQSPQHRGRSLRRAQRPVRLKRIPNRRNLARLRRRQQRPQNSREQMRVLVRVEMRNPQSRRPQPLHLRRRFRRDLRRANAKREQIPDKRRQRRPKLLPVRAQRRNLRRRQHRGPVHQQHMASHLQPWSRPRHRHRVVEVRPGRHQRRRRQRACAMQFTNGSVDARRKAEVIGINNKGHENQRTAFGVQRSEP